MSSASASSTAKTTSIGNLFDSGAGAALDSAGEDWDTLIYAIYVALLSFVGQFVAFVLLRWRLSRLYRPKSYLVAERERVPAPPKGLWQWIVPLFTTPNSVFIEKCGLDAYFFLRFLRMLLKIFIPLAFVILPILLPINKYSGTGLTTGPDQLGWRNISPKHTHRTWAHLVLAVLAVAWILYVIYQELRGYIRIRQAYLSSPQHRLRASATTVLVSGIPRKWLTVEALNGLYDVFPGGIRNIWINKNFDELAEKVTERDNIARSLEDAETTLIRICLKNHKKAEEKKAKGKGRKKTKAEKEQDRVNANEQAEHTAQADGISSGDPHQTPHNLQEVLEEMEGEKHGKDHSREQHWNKLGLGQGFGAVGHGIGAIGKIGRHFVGEVTEDVNRAFRSVNETVDRANYLEGFEADPDEFSNTISQDKPHEPVATPAVNGTSVQQHQIDTQLEAPKSLDKFPIQSGTDEPTGLSDPAGVSVLDRPAPIATENLKPGSSESPTSATQSANTDIADPSPVKRNYYTKSKSHPRRLWEAFLRQKKAPPLPFPSPQPHTAEEDEYPLRNLASSQHPDSNEDAQEDGAKSKFGWLKFWSKDSEEEEKPVYPESFDKEVAEDEDGEPVWKKYLEPKDRETLREPIFAKSWFPRLPLMGKKIDKIYHLRKELARLNVEIEEDQQNTDRFPFMNSAFIQFNHQVAAHMACQSLSHHVPQHMAPRIVEISPTDVLWENMSTKWWERLLRSFLAFAAVVGMIFLYAPLVTFTGLLSTLNTLATISWLSWISQIPSRVQSLIEGILPPVLLSAILTLVPIMLRLLVKQEGVPTGNDREMGVQSYYFAFLFIQVFLIVTLSSGLPTFFVEVTTDTTKYFKTLASNLTRSSNYFFSYLIVQALSNSASALVQVAGLLKWFLWAPLRDNTARQKWARQTDLQTVKWGSFFPQYTNFAVIGIIYSIISPLIMVFNLIVFSIYWVTQRYNTLYVYKFQNDTGGLLFPKAINQLFTGLYFLEACLVGLFFAQTNTDGEVSAVPQAVIMIVVFVATAIFQWLLNDAMQPLFRYLPITLEDDAVIRDEEFARAQRHKWERLAAQNDDESEDIQDALEDRERQEAEEEQRALEKERRTIREKRRSSSRLSHRQTDHPTTHIMETKPAKDWSGDRWRQVKNISEPVKHLRNIAKPPDRRPNRKPTAFGGINPQDTKVDVESQQAVGDILYGGFSDELEDLTPEERDTLIRYSFQHSALRARRPVVWIPRDKLGISDDEIRRTMHMSTVETIDSQTEKREKKTNIWISNDGTALDAKGRVVFRRSPPDFANVDLIAL